MTPEIRELKKVLDGIAGHVKNTLAQCMAAGKLLSQIKEKTKYGDWNLVLESVELSQHTADRYMLFWERRSELDMKEVKTLSDAHQLVSKKNTKIATIARPTTQNETVTSENQSVPEPHQDTSETPPPEPKIQRDKIGRPIPEGILELWNHAHEIGTKLRSMVSEVKCAIDKGIKGDKAFAEISNPVVSDAEALHYSLSQVLPHAVCPKCQGKDSNKCSTCRHRGFVSKTYWDGPCVEKDLRNLIKRQYESASISA